MLILWIWSSQGKLSFGEGLYIIPSICYIADRHVCEDSGSQFRSPLIHSDIMTPFDAPGKQAC